MLGLKDKVKVLKKTDFFSKASDQTISRVANMMKELSFKHGEVIIQEDTPGNEFYILAAGKAEVRKEGISIKVLHENESFGELSLIDDSPRSASVISLSEAHLLKLEREDFKNLMSQEPSVCLGLFHVLAEMVRRETQKEIAVMRKKIEFEHEVKRAGDIQKAMLPKEDLHRDDIEICGYCRPAESVGGDFYDYDVLPDGKTAVAIGDVTGHGLNAGLLMAVAKSCFKNQLRTGCAITEMMKALDHSIANITIPHTESGTNKAVLYMTFFYAVIDSKNLTMSYCNAGHPPVYRCSNSRTSKLESTNCPLGMATMLKMTDFRCHSMSINPGDLLILYSDGLIEEKNASGVPYGSDNLERVIFNSGQKNTPDFRDALLHDFHAHVGDKSPKDDVTLVIVKMKQ